MRAAGLQEQRVFGGVELGFDGVVGVDEGQVHIVQRSRQQGGFQFAELEILGFFTMSTGVAVMFFGSLSSISPRFCSSNSARPVLAGSLGMAMVAPSLSSLAALILRE